MELSLRNKRKNKRKALPYTTALSASAFFVLASGLKSYSC